MSIRALTGLAATLRDRGELGAAESALAEALRVCERAGFVPRIVHVHSALALTCMLGGRTDAARDAAAQAVALGQRVSDPVNAAYALEARGIAGEPAEAGEALRRAAERWQALDRRLDAARCQMLLGRRMLEGEPANGIETLTRAAALFDGLGVKHLSEQALALI